MPLDKIAVFNSSSIVKRPSKARSFQINEFKPNINPQNVVIIALEIEEISALQNDEAKLHIIVKMKTTNKYCK